MDEKELVQSTIEYYPVAVVGVGGAGCMAIRRLLQMGITTDGFVCLDSDDGSLARADVLAIRLDKQDSATAVEKAEADIRAALANAGAVCVVAGLGGQTASRAAPAVCGLVHRMGARLGLCVTMPLRFEGETRVAAARESLATMRKNASFESVCDLDELRRSPEFAKSGMEQMLEAFHLSLLSTLQVLAKPA